MLDPTRKPHVLKARSATSALLQQLDALLVLFPKPDNQGDHEAIADARDYIRLASICLADIGTDEPSSECDNEAI